MSSETVRSRFKKVMNGEMPADRLPFIEWCGWWDLTVNRWYQEGVPAHLDTHGVKSFFGLDMDYQLYFDQVHHDFTAKLYREDKPIVETEADYDAVLPYLYPEPMVYYQAVYGKSGIPPVGEDAIIWFSVDGFFGSPREFFGIEPHLYAFYDNPNLMHRMNQDLASHTRKVIEAVYQICKPDFMTFFEDMAYNHGPMISKPLFDEFMAPYYRQVVPRMKELGITVIIDSDGDVEPLIPWFDEVGIEGILPLERMAGVDVNRIRKNHPNWNMIGGFDKTLMHLGEERMRAEFERLLPVMRSGRFIPSVDHQTPPAVSVEDYRLYLSLLREYIARAVS